MCVRKVIGNLFKLVSSQCDSFFVGYTCNPTEIHRNMLDA